MTQKTKQGQKTPEQLAKAQRRGNWSAQHTPRAKTKVTLPTVSLQKPTTPSDKPSDT